MRYLLSWFLAGSLTATGAAFGAATENTAADPAVAIFSPLPAPKAGPMLLHVGDRLAICGDSITEQRMYSRLIEDYLTARYGNFILMRPPVEADTYFLWAAPFLVLIGAAGVAIFVISRARKAASPL